MEKPAGRKKTKPDSTPTGGQISLSTMVQARLTGMTSEIVALQEKQGSIAFSSLGELVNKWFLGKIKFIAREDVKIKGDTSKTFLKCGGEGFTINDLSNLRGKNINIAIPEIQSTVADLTYLLLKNAIFAEDLTYTSPSFTTITSILDVEAVKKLLPGGTLVPDFKGVSGVAIAIVVVDVVVLVLDYARSKA